MEEFISRIQQINKDELDEREFYEQVLDIIKEMEGVSLTPQTFEQLKNTPLIVITLIVFHFDISGSDNKAEQLQNI